MRLAGTPNRDGIPVIENYAGPGQDRVGIAKEIEPRESNQPLKTAGSTYGSGLME